MSADRQCEVRLAPDSFTPREPTVGSRSPWGKIQFVNVLAHGIVNVTTASHGGVWLSPARIRLVPLDGHRNPFVLGSWFEEDCQAALALWPFRSELKRGKSIQDWQAMCAHLRESIAQWHPEALEAMGIAVKYDAGC